MMLLPFLVAAGLANAPPAVMLGIQLYQLQHGQDVVGSFPRHEELSQGEGTGAAATWFETRHSNRGALG